MAKVEIYDIGFDALHQLFPNDIAGVRVGDYLLVSWGGNKNFLYPAPVINKCCDRDTAFALAGDIATGRCECFFQLNGYGYAFDREIWHVVDYVIEPSSCSFYVSLSNEVCGTPNDVYASEIGYADFDTYDAAEGFAIRNVCESIPSVLVSYYDHDVDERFPLEPLRFLRWVDCSSGHDHRFGAFYESRCPDFSFPTKSGSIFKTLNALMQLRDAGDC